MTETQISVDAENINKMVIKAMIKGDVFARLEKIVKNELEKLESNWDNPYEFIINREMYREIEWRLKIEKISVIERGVREDLTSYMVHRVVSTFWDILVKQCTGN